MEIYTKTVPHWRSTQFYVRTTATAKTKCLLACIFYTVQTKYPPMYCNGPIGQIQI